MKLVELNRKKIVYIWCVILMLILIISGVLVFTYIKRDKVYYVHYYDQGNLDYKVALKENEYFDDHYMEKENQYIASLIDFIDADFKYDLSVEEDLEYSYKYKIVANVNVIDDTTNKNIYTFSEDLLEEKTGQSNRNLNIEENVKIDYNKYNDLISKFVSVYNLKNVTSKLTIDMYVGIAGNIEDLQKEKDSDISLEIPLTTNTVDINTKYNLSDNVGDLITLKSNYTNSKKILKLAIMFFVTDLVLLVGLILYIKKSETKEEKYNYQLKKILNNYGSYISKIEDEFDMNGYQILKVQNFVDLLEIRDTMHIPIIMMENKENLVTSFIIATDNKILYFYSLGVTQYALPTGKENKEEVKENDFSQNV